MAKKATKCGAEFKDDSFVKRFQKKMLVEEADTSRNQVTD
jgi:hypothetical protein